MSNQSQPLQTRATTVCNGVTDITSIVSGFRNKKKNPYGETVTADAGFFVGQALFEDVGACHSVESRDQNVRVQGLLNLLPVKDGVLAVDMQLELYKQVRFVGFSNSNVHYDSNSPAMTESPSLHIGGIKTVLNTGLKRIDFGDAVCWSLPSPTRISTQCDKEQSLNLSRNARILELEPLFDDNQRRVVGVAMESAKPGEWFALNVSM